LANYFSFVTNYISLFNCIGVVRRTLWALFNRISLFSINCVLQEHLSSLRDLKPSIIYFYPPKAPTELKTQSPF